MKIMQDIIFLLQAPENTEIPVQGTIFWDSEVPIEVRVDFQVNIGRAITWVFGRDLINDAFSHPGTHTGIGDVRVKVLDGWIGLLISSPFGHATFRTQAPPVEEFIRRTYEKTPHGAAEVAALPLQDDRIAEWLSSA